MRTSVLVLVDLLLYMPQPATLGVTLYSSHFEIQYAAISPHILPDPIDCMRCFIAGVSTIIQFIKIIIFNKMYELKIVS